tara:strand:- start:1250 stop:1876 length:627 start_codon:yes stop_codon:yes gene_type:complete
MYYVPRVIKNKDEIYGADDISEYNRAYPVELYIKSVDGFAGDGNFMSKFGLEIRDQVVFSIAQRVFYEEVGMDSALLRPNEGDLIHFPLNNKLFKIMYVNKFEMFYQLGALQTWEITCELFEYSSEKFNTGIAEIDSIQQNLSLNVFDWALLDEDGERIIDENSDYIVMENFTLETIDALADNSFIQSETDDFLDFTEKDPFSETGIF